MNPEYVRERPRMRIPAATTSFGLCTLGVAAVAASCSHGGTPTLAASKHVLGCNQSVGGTLPRGWEHDALSSGSLSLYFFEDYRKLKPSVFAHVGGHPDFFRPFKVLAIVRRGETVTLAIPTNERSVISLLYGVQFSRLPDAVPVSRGVTSVTFKGCPSGDTQFAGGFVVAGPRCTMLEVAGKTGVAKSLSVPFGRPCST
jgi:hypothetical protein